MEAVAKARKADNKKAAAKKEDASSPSASPQALVAETEEQQLGLYEQALVSFRSADFRKALKLFEAAAQGPEGGLRHRSNVHARICRQRIGSDTVDLKSADDHYNYAIRLINDRRLDEASVHLEKALRAAQKPPAHIHYALAVTAALNDDSEATLASLRRAIEIDPRQRLLARRDPDLGKVVRSPLIADLLAGDGSTGAGT
ncbi:MAG: hypothetical protein GC160_23580 [Acidobacteria bacterium]|nr:hypothetical protein [Acidobacteriota bacterium]